MTQQDHIRFGQTPRNAGCVSVLLLLSRLWACHHPARPLRGCAFSLSRQWLRI